MLSLLLVLLLPWHWAGRVAWWLTVCVVCRYRLKELFTHEQTLEALEEQKAATVSMHVSMCLCGRVAVWFCVGHA